MRKTLFFTIGIAIACGAIYLFDRFDASSAAEKPEKPKLRATVIFPAAKDSEYAPVSFSHTSHARFGYKKCKDCHDDKIFSEDKSLNSNKMTMDDINEGKFCGHCHNGTTKVMQGDKPGDEVVFAPTMEGVEMCVLCHNVKSREAPKAAK
ncbi:MAG TPA: cytochrome c3 family protein [Planctomycetota bacterium]|jgi:c(7)-type cytochrome triheme protein|nr:cytochrome c3 family protein [Planctomycetota bacterium]OQC21249.1 MAG: Class III cytochrome C family protein [Planctomycetes bacterium ADurb.Bin069]NMD36796.1 hypothetical protein [Planctomycetota bacterium]HNS00282.1 cytochrome c3 family protein [Planctomycetota bacterium]HOE31026.1 cytochrome c3 family protein [Planctomycetota bacterium]